MTRWRCAKSCIHELGLARTRHRGGRTAVIAPEIFMSHGEFITTLKDARLPAVLCASAYYFWRRGILGTIVVGMLVYLPLHIGWGW
ncbi:MAG: hypothetical protein B7Y20_13490 [Acidovorax sp. 16-64-162]|nr:MAG: hypothetical protein B7Y20_13490 [Acidovorax sp. 16-64-162]